MPLPRLEMKNTPSTAKMCSWLKSIPGYLFDFGAGQACLAIVCTYKGQTLAPGTETYAGFRLEASLWALGLFHAPEAYTLLLPYGSAGPLVGLDSQGYPRPFARGPPPGLTQAFGAQGPFNPQGYPKTSKEAQDPLVTPPSGTDMLLVWRFQE